MKKILYLLIIVGFSCKKVSSVYAPVQSANAIISNHTFASQKEMTAKGGQPYDEFYWLNTNLSSLSKSVFFPESSSYRFDLSGYAVKGSSVITVLIDGVIKGKMTINETSIRIYSVLVNSISSGNHTVTLELSNFSAGANHCRLGLLYWTASNSSTPETNPEIAPLSLTPGQFVTADHFRSKVLRGFNLSSIYTLSELKAKNIPAARATGANLGRYWISIAHAPGSSNYYFCNNSGTSISTSLSTLDSAVKIAQSQGMYLILTLQVLPIQGACDLWGTSNEAIARRNGVKAIWQQLATRYKNKPIIAAYDLINEPRSNFNYAEYLRWQEELIESIRAIDPNHVIAVECLKNNMYAMMLPLPYPNLIYSPHSYSPLSITHQGINAYLGSITPQSRKTYPDGGWDKTDMSDALKDVRTFSNRFNVPIWIGELSCINWAPKNSYGEWTSTKWIDDNISLLESEGWSWTYHAWREFQAWDAEIPSSFYSGFTYSNAAPFTRSAIPSNWSSARSGTAPTITMLKKWFRLNQ